MSHTKKTLTLHEKIQIIEAIERQKMPVRAVAAQFGIGKTQAAIIIKNKEIIKYKWNSGAHPSEKKVHFRSDGFIIDQLCWAWYAKSKSEGEQLTGQMIKAKGKEIAEELGNMTFKASDGWLQKWRKRHCITSRGENADYNYHLVEPYLSESTTEHHFDNNPASVHKKLDNLDMMTHKPQYNHMNNLLPAASTNLTLSTMDVDSLLTPLGRSTSPRSTNSDWQRNMDQRPERNLWRIEEIMEMLNTMQDLHALELLNDKTVKSETVFREVELEMNKKGYCKKSHVQIWTKWKFLKSTYTTSKRAGVTPKMIAPQVYDMLHTMLTNNNALLMSRSQSSLRTDISESGNSLASNNDDSDTSSRIVISGVESNYNMSQNKTREESEEESGLAHPIFGFRLGGLVKQEPADNGYEHVQNGIIEPEVQLQASTSNLRFRTNFNTETVPSPTHLESENNFINIRNQFTTGGTSTSSPNNPHFNSTPSTKNNLPMLRIAPFAKDPIPHQATKDVNHELRIASVRTTATPELLVGRNGKSYKMQNSSMEKLRNPNTANVTQLRLKHTPLRKTPIPERLVSESPKHYRDHDSDADYMPYKYQADTSHKTKKRMHEMKFEDSYAKKRKSEKMDYNWQGRYNDKNDTHEDYEEDDNSSDDLLFNSSMHNDSNSRSTTKMEALFNNLTKSFQRTLYNSQHEMMNQFIVNQMQLVRKEHEFQMKQDSAMMAAMKKQSEEFWANAKKFLATELNQHKNKDNKVETCEKACQTTELLNENDKGEGEEEEEKASLKEEQVKDNEQNQTASERDETESDSDSSDEVSQDEPESEQRGEQMEHENAEQQQQENDYAGEAEEEVEEVEHDNDNYAVEDDTHLRPIGDLLQCSLDY